MTCTREKGTELAAHQTRAEDTVAGALFENDPRIAELAVLTGEVIMTFPPDLVHLRCESL